MIRFKKLGYIALNVTDVERSLEFYRDVIGLGQTGPVQDGVAFLTTGSDYHNIMLFPSDKPGVKRVGFEMEDLNQLDNAFHLLKEKGLNPVEVSAEERAKLKIGKAIRFRDPNGLMLELFAGMMQRAEAFKPNPIKINQLDHVVFKVPNFEETLKFYTDTLNFKVSDYRYKPTGDLYFAFMRCFPNPYHHSFGLVEADQLSFFHLAFKVTDIDDIGRGRNRLINQDVPVVFGPGRHKASESIFMYFLDPDGLTAEYTLGMEEFPEEGARPPRMLDNTLQTTDQWEGKVDPRTGKVGYVELEETVKV